jgi:hypothetical protein
MDTAATKLVPSEVADLLAAASAEIQAEMRALPEALVSWHPAPGGWCAKEVLGHIMEAERRGFAGRIRLILSSSEPRRLPSWDQQAVQRERRDCEKATADLLNEFVALRLDSVKLVRELTAADLVRGGEHETVGYLTVADLLQEWLHHDRNHFKQMLTNLQEAVWPYMGNTQKFSGE